MSPSRNSVRLALAALVTSAIIFAAQETRGALFEFNLNSFTAYVNNPTYNSGTGTLIFQNTIAAGASQYQTGVGATTMPVYSAGQVLQWAILMRSTQVASFLNIGVQSGSGDVNNLSVTNQLLATNGGYTWVFSSPVTVNTFKPNAYFWIPGALGQEIDVRRILVGDPAAIALAIPESGPGVALFVGAITSLLFVRRRLDLQSS